MDKRSVLKVVFPASEGTDPFLRGKAVKSAWVER